MVRRREAWEETSLTPLELEDEERYREEGDDPDDGRDEAEVDVCLEEVPAPSEH